MVTALCLLSVALHVANGQNFNNMFDQTVSESIKENMAEIEPLIVPDLSDMLGNNHQRARGGIRMSNVRLHGLSSIRRSGDASMTQGNGGTLINLKLAVSNIRFEGNAQSSFIGFRSGRDVNGRISHMDMAVKTLLKEDGTMTILDLKLNELHGLTMRIVGRRTGFHELLNSAFRGLSVMFRGTIKRKVESAMHKVINKVLQNPKLAEMIG